MFRRLLLLVTAAGFATWLSSSTAEAQLYQKFYVSPRITPSYIPHTTTHFHHVPHGNHIHVIPHSTTHFDRVNNYGVYGTGYGAGYGAGYGIGIGYGTGLGYGAHYGSYYGDYHSHHYGSRNYWGNGHCHPF